MLVLFFLASNFTVKKAQFYMSDINKKESARTLELIF